MADERKKDAAQFGSPAHEGADASPAETARIPKVTDAAADASAVSQQEDAEGLEAFQNLERSRKDRRLRKRRKIIVALCIAAAVIAAIVLPKVLQSSSSGYIPTPTATVERRDLTDSVSVSGSTQPVSSVVVTPEVDGIIQDVRVSEGDTVNAGDVLFTLKNDSLDRAVTEAQGQVDAAQRQVKSAQTALDRAYKTYKDAVKAWNAAPDAEAQAAMTDPDNLYADVETANATLEDAKASLQSAQQTLDDAKSTAAKRTVTAPVSGSVVAVGAKNGAAFGSAAGATSSDSSTTLVQIADLSQMRVNTQVNEVDISSLQPGQTATVTFSALPDLTLDATVERIATVSTGSSDPSSQYGGMGVVSYNVSLLIANPDPRLKPGMTANATIQTKSVPNSLVVPLAALIDNSDGTTSVNVVTLDDQGNVTSSQLTEVQVVDKTSSEAAVTGVEEGQLVQLASGDSDASMYGDSGQAA